MSSSETDYYLPEPSKWPVIAVAGIFTLLLGVILWANGVSAGNIILPVGFIIILFLFHGWFKDVINENLSGKYNEGVSTSFRQDKPEYQLIIIVFLQSPVGPRQRYTRGQKYDGIP